MDGVPRGAGAVRTGVRGIRGGKRRERRAAARPRRKRHGIFRGREDRDSTRVGRRRRLYEGFQDLPESASAKGRTPSGTSAAALLARVFDHRVQRQDRVDALFAFASATKRDDPLRLPSGTAENEVRHAVYVQVVRILMPVRGTVGFGLARATDGRAARPRARCSEQGAWRAKRECIDTLTPLGGNVDDTNSTTWACSPRYILCV